MISQAVLAAAIAFSVLIAAPANFANHDHCFDYRVRDWATFCNWIAAGAFALAGVFWLFKA